MKTFSQTAAGSDRGIFFRGSTKVRQIYSSENFKREFSQPHFHYYFIRSNCNKYSPLSTFFSKNYFVNGVLHVAIRSDSFLINNFSCACIFFQYWGLLTIIFGKFSFVGYIKLTNNICLNFFTVLRIIRCGVSFQAEWEGGYLVLFFSGPINW